MESKRVSQSIVDQFTYLEAVTNGWMDFYQVSSEETMVFGDSLNDASMVEYSIVMSNGDAELKDTFSYEIGSNDEQAVLDILEEVLDNERVDFMEKYKK